MAVSLEKIAGKDSQMLKAESRVSIAGLKRGLHFVENGRHCSFQQGNDLD